MSKFTQLWSDTLGSIALSLWLVFPLLVAAYNIALVFFFNLLPRWFVAGSITVQLILVALPLDIPAPWPLRRFIQYSAESYNNYFSVKMVYEDRDALIKHAARSTPIVYGYEPHGVLPTGMCAFSPFNDRISKELAQSHAIITSTCFYVPILRHIFHWAACRPATKEVCPAPRHSYIYQRTQAPTFVAGYI